MRRQAVLPLSPEYWCPTVKCIADAWHTYQRELFEFVRARGETREDAYDLVHEVFLRALKQPNGLCGMRSPRGWLFQVARNLLIDAHRTRREGVPLDDDVPAPIPPEDAPVEALTQCLPRVLAELASEDREAIMLCDIEGLSHRAYAARIGISLPAAKSRVLRARKRLRSRLVAACHVRFDELERVCCFGKPGAG